MKNHAARFVWLFFASLWLFSGCQPVAPASPTPALFLMPDFTAAAPPVVTPAPSSTPAPAVPRFSRIGFIVLEGKEYDSVVGDRDMPYFNLLASSYALLTQYYAPAEASLPNYLALLGGETFGVTDDCEDRDCRIAAPSLPDLIEASGRTWKTYQDDMPAPCFAQDAGRYLRRHNPFIFFDSIRANAERCFLRVAPLTELDADLAADALPDFFFISPDICYSSQECGLNFADEWLKQELTKIYPALEATGEPFLLVVTWDKGQSPATCCGLHPPGGGRVATILISPLAKRSFQDHTLYSHYSLLKTVAESWGLPFLGRAADANTALIAAPWK